MKFDDLGIDRFLVEALASVSIHAPTPVQENCIPQILMGKDVIASAKTGSGKTIAFGLPILQELSQDPFGIFALVLTPTRELAFQIAEQLRIFGKCVSLKQAVIVGGMDMMSQALELNQRPHIVIATPGRLVDHFKSGQHATHFKRLKYLVLDEADRLCSPTFTPDISTILSHLPTTRRTLLFSATMTPEIEAAAKPTTFIYQSPQYGTVDKLEQKYLLIPSSVKEIYLVDIIHSLENKSMIIFTGKCKTAEYLRLLLKELGLRSTALHSKMPQADRLSSLAKFKTGIVSILICTDVAGRGIDIPTVSAVINYELPADATDYIHRIGRTARAGRGGESFALVTEHDIDILTNIETKMEKKMNEIQLNENKVLERLNQVTTGKRMALMTLRDSKFGIKQKIHKQKNKS